MSEMALVPCATPLAMVLTLAIPLAASLNDIFGLSLPTFFSIATDAHSKQQWLLYWVFYHLLEYSLDLIIDYVPLIFEIKLLFLVWLYHPWSRGSLLFLEEVLERHAAILKPLYSVVAKISGTSGAAPPNIRSTTVGGTTGRNSSASGKANTGAGAAVPSSGGDEDLGGAEDSFKGRGTNSKPAANGESKFDKGQEEEDPAPPKNEEEEAEENEPVVA